MTVALTALRRLCIISDHPCISITGEDKPQSLSFKACCISFAISALYDAWVDQN
jgi:hypothetical protein